LKNAPYLPDESRLIQASLKYPDRLNPEASLDSSLRPSPPRRLITSPGVARPIPDLGDAHDAHGHGESERKRGRVDPRCAGEERGLAVASRERDQRARTGGDGNQGTSEPASSHARNLQLPPAAGDIHARCCRPTLGRASRGTLHERVARSAECRTRGAPTDACGWSGI